MKAKDQKGNSYMSQYEAVKNSGQGRRKNAATFDNKEMAAAPRAYGSDIPPNRKNPIPSYNQASKWLGENNVRGSTHNGNNNHAYPQAHLLLLSPDPLLSKNHKVNAQLAPLNHLSPGMLGQGIVPNGKASGVITSIPSIEHLATYNKL